MTYYKLHKDSQFVLLSAHQAWLSSLTVHSCNLQLLSIAPDVVIAIPSLHDKKASRLVMVIPLALHKTGDDVGQSDGLL